jgi:four helix bundle protein
MAGWKDFREIKAWQLSHDVKLHVYQLLEREDVRRRYKYCEQLADAARSAPSNIAEGFGRFGNKEFARFSRIAKGSLNEVLNHMIDARDLRLLSNDEFLAHEHRIHKALKATAGLIRHLEFTPDPPRGPKLRPKRNPNPNPNRNPNPNPSEPNPSEPPEPPEPSEP